MKWTIVLCGFLTLTGAEYYVFLDGERPHEGNIQIYNGSVWFNLCTDGWDNDDAAVICRMAGYTGNGAVASESNNGFTFSSLVKQKFDCTGTEQTLDACPTSSNNVTACANSTLSHVTCSVDPAPNDFFLISFGSSIARMDRQSASASMIQSETVDRVIAITYDSVQDNIIWTDILKYQIAMCGLHGGNITVLYQATNASKMDGMAIDEGSRLLFYTDTGYDEIGTVNIDTLVRTVIITTDLDEPRAIALDTVTREIFWTDWGGSPTIKRANYDGSAITTIVNTGLGWPNALSLNGDVLTWCDAQVDVYERINRNGTGRIQLASFSSQCFDFTIFEDYIYANDWVYTRVQRMETDGSLRDSFGPPFIKRYGIFHYIKDISTPPPTAQTSNVTATTQTNPLTRSDIDCGGSSISLHVPLDLLPSGQQVTWNDPACVVSNNGTHLTGDIDLGECGTYVVFNTTHVIFENELVSHASTTNNTSGAHSVIDYGNGPDSVIVVQCVYPRREQESLGFRPIQGQVRFYEKTLGHMQIHMREARDVLFDDMYPSQTEPRVVHLNDPIYIKLDTEQGNTTKVAINVDRCLATPSPSPLDTDFQELTDNGCPALPSVTIHSSPVSEVHLSFQAFKFTNHPSAPVYVHCEVYVCPLSDPHCVTGCMDSVARTRRAATGGIKTHLVSTGPFPVADDKDQGAFGGESTALVAVTGLCAVLAVAATVFGVMAWRGRRRLPLKETLVQ